LGGLGLQAMQDPLSFVKSVGIRITRVPNRPARLWPEALSLCEAF
jgi:hypothetical protein